MDDNKPHSKVSQLRSDFQGACLVDNLFGTDYATGLVKKMAESQKNNQASAEDIPAIPLTKTRIQAMYKILQEDTAGKYDAVKSFLKTGENTMREFIEGTANNPELVKFLREFAQAEKQNTPLSLTAYENDIKPISLALCDYDTREPFLKMIGLVEDWEEIQPILKDLNKEIDAQIKGMTLAPENNPDQNNLNTASSPSWSNPDAGPPR